MKFKINSIKNRILIGFLSIVFISTFIYILSYYYLDKINTIRSLDREISEAEVLTLNLIKADNDFFDLESINPRYFKTMQSDLLERRDSIKRLLDSKFDMLPRVVSAYFNIHKNLNQLDSTITLYDERFNELAGKVYERGFKDYGLEGEMREYAHALENEIKMANILSLRRHEKDFFLRNDEDYIKKHNTLSGEILKDLRKDGESENAIRLLENYSNTFNRLAAVQRKIGLNSNEGLRRELNDLTFELNDQFAQLSATTGVQADELINRVLAIYILSGILSLIIAICLSYLIAIRLSKPIKKLSLLMNRYMTRKSKNEMPLTLNNPTSEIENLSKSFFALMKQTESQMKEIKKKSLQMRRKNNELKKLNEELDKFIYSTAHDLRSPLSSVLGLIHLAEFDKNDEQRDKYLEMMKGSISKMESFIKDVVDYSKNKKLEVDISAIDIERLVRDIFGDHRFIPACENITLHVDMEGGKYVYSDLNRLRIIFNNLISNAIRYSDTSKTEPFIKIYVAIEKKQFTIKFTDNGQGIDQDHLNKIFNMFYRANEGSSGSGLGLFILKETIMMLRGDVEVQSIVKEGTTFIITLPNKIKAYNYKTHSAQAVLN